MNIKQTIGHNTDQPHGAILSQDISTIASTSARIKGVLDINDQEQVTNSQNRLSELLGELELEIEKISNEISFNYNEYDYINRLSQNKTLIKTTFEKLLLDNKQLSLIYNELLQLFDIFGSKEALSKTLYTEYFEDIVYESIDKVGLVDRHNSKVNYPKIELIELLSSRVGFVDCINKNFDGDIVNFNIWDYHLSSLDNSQLDYLFSFYTQSNLINLSFSALHKLDEDQLGIIFKHLSNIKSIRLNFNELGLINNRRLDIIFRHLYNIRFINLKVNQLGTLDIKNLLTIFNSLSNIRSLTFLAKELLDFSVQDLKIIFSNLKNIKSLDFSGQELGSLDIKKLSNIFESMNNVLFVNLSNNNLHLLNEGELRILFEHLANTKMINIGANYLNVSKIELIKQLCPVTQFTDN